MTVIGSIFENNIAGGNGGAIIARRSTNISHSMIYNNHDSNGYAIFNQTWDECCYANDWWGSNNPDFENLLNFNVSDDFTWIIMKFGNSSQLLQFRDINLIVSLNEVSDKKGNIFNINSSELLADFDLSLNNNRYKISNGILSVVTFAADINSITAKVNDESITLGIIGNPLSITENKNIVEDYDGKTTYKVRIIDSYGVAISNIDVIFKVNKKTYHVKTDKNGYASYTFSLTPGKYTIYIISQGKTIKNKITIKNVLKAKSITKKKAKKIKYNAYLKSSNGKPIAGKNHL